MMSAATIQQPPDAPLPRGRVETAIPCINCGYKLLGLDQTALCPECAAPVRDSAEGALLAYTGPRHIHTLHTGAFYVLLGVVMSVLFWVASVIVSVKDADAAITAPLTLGALAFNLLGLYGWWRLTTPSPAGAGADTGRHRRGALRSAVSMLAAVHIMRAPVELYSEIQLGAGKDLLVNTSMIAFGLTALALMVIQVYASLYYVSWLARRVPDPALMRRALRYRWLLPLIGVLAFFVTPAIEEILFPATSIFEVVSNLVYSLAAALLAPLVMYYLLINRLRRRLKALDQRFNRAAMA